jgi:hypothetical protein
MRRTAISPQGSRPVTDFTRRVSRRGRPASVEEHQPPFQSEAKAGRSLRFRCCMGEHRIMALHLRGEKEKAPAPPLLVCFVPVGVLLFCSLQSCLFLHSEPPEMMKWGSFQSRFCTFDSEFSFNSRSTPVLVLGALLVSANFCLQVHSDSARCYRKRWWRHRTSGWLMAIRDVKISRWPECISRRIAICYFRKQSELSVEMR